jgi:hypothetical protein
MDGIFWFLPWYVSLSFFVIACHRSHVVCNLYANAFVSLYHIDIALFFVVSGGSNPSPSATHSLVSFTLDSKDRVCNLAENGPGMAPT